MKIKRWHYMRANGEIQGMYLIYTYKMINENISYYDNNYTQQKGSLNKTNI